MELSWRSPSCFTHTNTSKHTFERTHHVQTNHHPCRVRWVFHPQTVPIPTALLRGEGQHNTLQECSSDFKSLSTASVGCVPLPRTYILTQFPVPPKKQSNPFIIEGHSIGVYANCIFSRSNLFKSSVKGIWKLGITSGQLILYGTTFAGGRICSY